MENVENILSLIPQKPPFVMIDSLLYAEDAFARSTFKVTDKNIFTINGQFSEAGLMENIAQTVAAHAGYFSHIKNQPIAVGYIVLVKNFEIASLPKLNDELITEIIIEEQVMNLCIISGKVMHNDILLAKCEMNLFIEGDVVSE